MTKNEINKIADKMREELAKLDNTKMTDDAHTLPEENDIVVTMYASKK